jgi:NTE family protein
MKLDEPICLALSGGGTKGIAHAGVLQFLDENNVEISKIAATSAGSIVGGLYSAGVKPQEILNFFKSIHLFSWKHFTIKKPGLIDPKSFRQYFYNIIEDITIEEATIPIYITATNLVTGKLKVFNKEEKLVDAILASASVPGVISPYKMGDNLYADGGILNNFPTDLLQTNCDFLMGVYVNPLQELSVKEISSIKAVTLRSFELLSVKEMFFKREYCNLLLEPQGLGKYGTFETSTQKMEEIYEIGYQSAKEVLSKLL